MMLNETNLPKYYLADVVRTIFNVMNHAFTRPIIKRTTYDLYKGRNTNISHLHVFGWKIFILNNKKDKLIKLDIKAYEDIFIQYSTLRKAFKSLAKEHWLHENQFMLLFVKLNLNL